MSDDRLVAAIQASSADWPRGGHQRRAELCPRDVDEELVVGGRIAVNRSGTPKPPSVWDFPGYRDSVVADSILWFESDDTVAWGQCSGMSAEIDTATALRRAEQVAC